MHQLRKLADLWFSPKWVTHLGCVKGCLEYLDLDVSDAWLYGATGHAFILNVHERVGPSGPTAWNTEMLFKLGENIGYEVDGVFGMSSEGDFAKKQKRAWDKTREAIDHDLPCYGWELDLPEFYVIHGYDDNGYLYRDFDNSEKGPKPWREIADTEIGVLEIYFVRPTQPTDDRTAVKEALQFVTQHAGEPENWTFSGYRTGIAGYDNWIHALEAGEADAFGHSYNAVVWHECREFAVDFLKELRKRLGQEYIALFDEAVQTYETVAGNLKKLSETFPFEGSDTEDEDIKDPSRVKQALEYLRNARDAEAYGLSRLEAIEDNL